ncbi:MAG: AAA family ATPase [Planctomycetes bacterium]|nr:AAA family ATPase [Planctomycetota bacterium]
MMLSERYRPKAWTDFVAQPIIAEIEQACGDEWLFDGGGERQLFESDGIAGCGKTSAAYVTAKALGCSDFAIERIDSRASTVADLRQIAMSMHTYGCSDNGRKCYVIDEIQHLNRDCLRMLLGLLENLPKHVIVIATTTSVTWADDIDGLYSRWRKFRFRKPSAPDVAAHLERIAGELGLTIPPGFRFVSYVQGKYGDGKSVANNIRDCIDGLPDALRRYRGKVRAA